MDKINGTKLKDRIKIKPSFFIYVFVCLLIALTLSVITVHIVDTFVSTVSVYYIDGNEDIDRINEDRDEDVYIAVEMIDEDFNEDNSDAILFYSRNWIVIAMLIFYFIFAIIVAAQTFFKRKLDTPLRELEEAAQKISEKNLDFKIEYSGDDEMGKLCKSFETMRYQLEQNNIEMWNMIDEQKRVQHVIAHDIRTPLTVTKGYTDILLDYVPKGKLSEEKILVTIECINRNIVRLEKFIDLMSDMQKLDQIKINKETIDIKVLFENLKENAQAICNGKELVFSGMADSESIYTDSFVIEQIITNLISNAVRYAKSQVMLDCNYKEGHLIITVRDDGKGFSEEALRYAFEPYYTQENKNDGVHYGLGLAICKTLCKKLDGIITYGNNNGAEVVVEI